MHICTSSSVDQIKNFKIAKKFLNIKINLKKNFTRNLNLQNLLYLSLGLSVLCLCAVFVLEHSTIKMEIRDTYLCNSGKNT